MLLHPTWILHKHPTFATRSTISRIHYISYMFVADRSSPNNATPEMQPNAKFDYSKVAGVAMKVLPAAYRAYQAASCKGDPCSACMAFAMALMPLV